jgi:chromosome segregation ATPase
MARAVCPGLERTASGYVCTYAQRPINPFQWYCFGDYYECPIYIQYIRSRGAQAKAEAKPAQTVQPLQQVQQTQQAVATPTTVTATARVEITSDTEDELIRSSEAIISKFEVSTKALNDKWRDYESSVQSAKKSWDGEKVKLRRYIMILEKIRNKYSDDLKEIEVRKSMGLIDNDTYNKLRESILKKLDKIDNKLKELNSKYQEIENVINQHYKKLLLTTVTPEISKLKLSLAKLEEMYRDGKISKEIYEKLKAEIEGVLS